MGLSLSLFNAMPLAVRALWRDLIEADLSLYLVGGAVRDILSEQADPHDWDFAVGATPEAVTALSEALGYQVVPSGLRFGTVTILTDAGGVEITTFRRDGAYTDGRHPATVHPASSIEEDLARRDFTINAIALTWDGTVIDPFGGRKDIENRSLRAVGDPLTRFYEDPLRVWRAARFAGRGWRLNPATRQAAQVASPRLRLISRERQRDELLKGLASPQVGSFLEAMEDLDTLDVLWPEWAALPESVTACAFAVAGAPLAVPPWLRLAGLLHGLVVHDDEKYLRPNAVNGLRRVTWISATALLERLALDGATAERIAAVLDTQDFPWDTATGADLRGLLRHLGPLTESIWLFRRMLESQGVYAPTGAARQSYIQGILSAGVAPLAVSGRDIMQRFGLKPGPTVGRWLAFLRDQVDADPTRNQRDSLFAMVDTAMMRKD